MFSSFYHKVTKTPGLSHIPHVFYPANVINPYYPHVFPQEFFIFQFPATSPTKRTA
jgi:hypothetical protein